MLVAQDAVMSPLRAPFTELQEKQSPKNVDEKPRGKGLRRSIGELITCKFCVGQWVASFFTYGLVFAPADRKSTRLNSSHANISYAVFCLKKKKKTFII